MKAERSMTLREEFQARRAASAPASGSLRLQQDLQAGVHPRAAKQAEKSRRRAAERRRRTSKERVTDWETFERTRPEDGYEATAKWDKEDKGDYPDEPRKRNLNPNKHRGGRERSEKKRKELQQERLTIQEEEDFIAMQMAELNETQEVRDQIAAVLRKAYLEKYGSEPGPSGSKGPDQPASESERADYEEELSDSSMDRLEEQLGQELDMPSEAEEELQGQDRERKKLEKREHEKKELERKELERKDREKRRYDSKKEDEKKVPAPRSSAPPPAKEQKHTLFGPMLKASAVILTMPLKAGSSRPKRERAKEANRRSSPSYCKRRCSQDGRSWR